MFSRIYKIAFVLAITVLSCSQLLSMPLFPEIAGHDIAFGARNTDVPLTVEWMTNGAQADTLTFTQKLLPDLNYQPYEATSYWPNWPLDPAYPIYNGSNPTPLFGGDLVLQVSFNNQDAPYINQQTNSQIDVSLTGTGTLEIWGDIPNPQIGSGLLWKINLDKVSLYGIANKQTYSLEGTGLIQESLIAAKYGLIGKSGAMRGSLDFFSNKPNGWIPNLYDPMTSPSRYNSNWNDDLSIRSAYSGETGLLVSEPFSIISLLVGGVSGLAFLRRYGK
jgi:hypothetical protein